jgi:hypothetical protein
VIYRERVHQRFGNEQIKHIKMNPSDLYHQHGVREQTCTRAEYGSKTIVLHIKTKRGMFYCLWMGEIKRALVFEQFF